MLRAAIRDAWRAVTRRKTEMVAISALAAVSAVGLTGRDAPGKTISAVATAASTGDVARAAFVTTKAARPGELLDLPNLDHPRVDSWVDRFTTDLRRSYATYLRRMTRYEGMIEQKLDRHGMPRDLIYLAMIESGFDSRARSRARAAGLWQFMAPTAKQFGLKVNRRVDERNDPARSTEAALKYLDYLHDRFGSWYLAAAAYNTGEGRVSRVLQQVTGRKRGTDADFYRIAHRLPRETRDYVPKLIAAARIGKDPARYGFN